MSLELSLPGCKKRHSHLQGNSFKKHLQQLACSGALVGLHRITVRMQGPVQAFNLPAARTLGKSMERDSPAQNLLLRRAQLGNSPQSRAEDVVESVHSS